MSAQIYTTRPHTTKDLVSRFNKLKDNTKEKRALHALATRMIYIFGDQNHISCCTEAACLVEIEDSSKFPKLLDAFLNVIIHRASYRELVDTPLLADLSFVLRQSKTALSRYSRLIVPLLDTLYRQLESLGPPEVEGQYHLVCSMSFVLDAMVDIQISDVTDEGLHDFLLPLLRDLKKDFCEPRLAQAAHYTYEALRGVHENEGRWQAFCRYSSIILKATPKTASAVPKFDPSKFAEVSKDATELLGLFQRIVEAGGDITGEYESVKGFFLDLDSMPEKRMWYVALRYSALLVEYRAFKMLKELLLHASCVEKYQFLCGLYAHLEQTWTSGDDDLKAQIVEFVNWTFDKLPLLRKDSRPLVSFKTPPVQAWIYFLADTLQQPHWKDKVSNKREWESMLPEKWRQRNWHRHPSQSFLQVFPQPNPRLEDHPSDLLDHAWAELELPRRLYAEISIAEHYTKGRCLAIIRISGETLSMEKCYVNLAITRPSEAMDANPETAVAHRKAEKQRLKALKTTNTDLDRKVALQTLFHCRTLQDGRTETPQRILIRGRPGTGKTTLCKKIVHEFYHNCMWTDYFDLVLWIPLWKLKKLRSINEFLKQEFSRVHTQDKLLFTALRTAIFSADKTVLFVLDGLEDIVGESSPSGADVIETFDALLSHQHVILTSRPYAIAPSNIDNFDLELETTGFYPDEIHAYMKKVVTKPGGFESMKDFVERSWLIQGLLQIPIHLDAFCLSLDKSDKDFRPNAKITMANVYHAIEKKLWRKDMARIKLIPPTTAQDYTHWAQIQHVMRHEIELLEMTAFMGLYNDLIKFDSRHRRALSSQFPGLNDGVLNKLSFLRTAEDSSGNSSASYYFIHLTFQEFFAARYFVSCWIQSKTLTCIRLDGSDRVHVGHVKPQRLIKREKYNGRYTIMWRFVAGLMSERSNEQLYKFMEILDGNPRDLLGPAHLEILMHCFSEISLSENDIALTRMATRMEHELSQLIRASRDSRRALRLASQMEFPEHLLEKALQNGSSCSVALRALKRRPFVSRSLLQKIRSYLESSNLGVYPAEVLSVHHKDIPDIIIDILGSSNGKARRILLQKLMVESALPGNIIRKALSLFSIGDRRLSFCVEILIKRQSHMPDELVPDLLALLASSSPAAKRVALYGLQRQAASDDDILRTIVNFMNDINCEVNEAAASSLLCCSSLPENALTALVGLLQDCNGGVARTAGLVLAKQHSLSDNALEVLTARVKYGQIPFAEAFCVLKDRSSRAYMDLISHLRSENPAVRQEALACVRLAQIFPDAFFDELASALRDEDHPEFRQTTLHAVIEVPKIPASVYNALISLLGNENFEVNRDTIFALTKGSPLPGEALAPLSSLLGGDHTAEVVRALGTCSTLPLHILKALVLLFNASERIEVDESIIWALRNQQTLPLTIVEELMALLPTTEELVAIRLNPTNAKWIKVERILRDREDFYKLLPTICGMVWRRLFDLWFTRSLGEEMSCYFRGHFLHINNPKGSFKIRVDPEDKDYIKGEAKGAVGNRLAFPGLWHEDADLETYFQKLDPDSDNDSTISVNPGLNLETRGSRLMRYRFLAGEEM